MVLLVLLKAGYTFGYLTFPILLVALATLTVGLATLIQNRIRILYLTFLVFTVVISLWQIVLIFLLSSNSVNIAQLWAPALSSLISAIPCFLYAFTTIMNRRMEDEKYFLMASFGFVVLLNWLIFTTNYISADVREFNWGFYPQAGQYFPVFLTFFGIVLIKILHVFYREINDESNGDLHVQRNKTLMIGTGIGYFAVIDFIPYYGYSIMPFGFIFILAGVVVYAFAITEYELAGLTDDRIASEIFMTIEEAVFVTDDNGNIELVNDTTRDLLAGNNTPIESQNIQEFLPENNNLISVLREEDMRTEGQEFDSKLSDRDGNQYHVRMKITPILEETRTPNEKEWYVFVAEDTTKLKEAQSKLDRATFKNPITGLPNEQSLEKDMNEYFEPCSAAVFIIIQDLKSMQANLETQESYRFLLRSVASRLRAVFSTNNFYHVSESEFFVYTTRDDDLRERFEELREDLTAPIDLGEERLHVNYAIGIVEDRPLEESFELSQSMAVNDASSQPGTAISQFNEEVTREHRRFFEVKHEILAALENDQITVSYHPQMFDDDVRGAEALLRWEHEEHGYIAPPKIVQAALEMNFEDKLLEHVLSTSMKSARSWDQNQILSVNISSEQLQYGDRLLKIIRRTAKEHKFPLERLEVELTEQAAVRNIDETRSILEDLRYHDVSISIDDFGTGYSSFKSLIKLPVDYLKIDKSFVLNLHEEEENKRIIEATSQIARGLDLDVIAEGVETENHIRFLRETGVRRMQGFYWTEPLQAGEYEGFVKEFSKNGGSPTAD